MDGFRNYLGSHDMLGFHVLNGSHDANGNSHSQWLALGAMVFTSMMARTQCTDFISGQALLYKEQ
jgi:hypothetical protein